MNCSNVVGLLKLKDEPAGNLSGGQKRLLEFARLAAGGPRLVLLDEPQAGVNPVLGERMAELIRAMVASDVTVLMVEHNLAFLERLCDHVIVMALGTCIATGSMAELRANRDVVDAASRPKVLLVDEPTAGMAPKFESAVWEHIVQVRQTGVAVVVVEQNTRRTLSHADWAYVLVLGRNRLSGPPAELLEDEEVVALYIGGGA